MNICKYQKYVWFIDRTTEWETLRRTDGRTDGQLIYALLQRHYNLLVKRQLNGCKAKFITHPVQKEDIVLTQLDVQFAKNW